MTLADPRATTAAEPEPAEPAEPAPPAETPERGWWDYKPQSSGAAWSMVQRARSQGRILGDEIYALAGVAVPVASAPAAAESAAAESAAVASPDPAQPELAPAPAPAHPAGRGWIPRSRDIGLPGEPAAAGGSGDDPRAALAGGPVFTRELRVRFLDHLAFKGNARAAARRVAVSHETAYRARRRDAAFAALWDAALVLARGYAEGELATRALDGVEVAVWHRGELVGHQLRHDARLLLAHLGRLDRRVDGDRAAGARAARFDELLVDYAGHPAPEGFADAAAEARGAADAAPDEPPTRHEYRTWCSGQALDALDESVTGPGDGREEAEIEAVAAAAEEADAEWEEWRDSGFDRLDAIVEGRLEPSANGEPGPADRSPAADPPVEVKSAPAWLRAAGRESSRPDRVTGVNTPRPGQPVDRGESAIGEPDRAACLPLAPVEPGVGSRDHADGAPVGATAPRGHPPATCLHNGPAICAITLPSGYVSNAPGSLLPLISPFRLATEADTRRKRAAAQSSSITSIAEALSPSANAVLSAKVSVVPSR